MVSNSVKLEQRVKGERKTRHKIVSDTMNWAPSCYSVFKLLISARMSAALWSNISDCDETFNYWEPLHLLLYGSGFQTWEYSPAYALRSYAYILLHSTPANVLQYVVTSSTKLSVFYFIRSMLAFLTAVAETLLYKAVRDCISRSMARHWFLLTFLCPGLFISSAAFLPSSFSMILNMFALTSFLNQYYFLAVLLTAVSAMLGWPFAAVLGLPIVLGLLVQKKVVKFILYSAVSGVSVGLFMFKVDTYYYGISVLAPLNILVYNVLESQGGSSLYGTEPWTFYVLNCFLNLNFIYLLGVLAPVVLGIAYAAIQRRANVKIYGARLKDILFINLSLFVWIFIFFSQPHKEERFLFPVYPLFTLSAAFLLDSSEKLTDFFLTSGFIKKASKVAYVFLMSLIGVMSVSRLASLYINYHAPMDVYMHLSQLSHQNATGAIALNSEVNVCVGKEWYRYPSSFFLPDHAWRLRFLRSEFRGILPKPYDEKFGIPEITRTIPSDMNDRNREEPSRYFPVEDCDFVIDFSTSAGSPTAGLEPNYAKQKTKWEIVFSKPFLDSAVSNRLYRAFYIPGLSERHCAYGDYVLLKRKLSKLKSQKIDRS